MIKAKIFLFFYIFFLIVLTSYHNIVFLLIFLLFLFFLSLSNVFKIFKKTLFSIIIFNSIISVSYILLNLLKAKIYWDYLILINLRVFVLTYMTFLFIKKVSIINALSFSKNLSMVLTLSLSQILSFLKLKEDFRHSFKSRVLKKPKKKEIYNFLSSMLFCFFNLSYNNIKEIALAMKSRGFYK